MIIMITINSNLKSWRLQVSKLDASIYYKNPHENIEYKNP